MYILKTFKRFFNFFKKQWSTDLCCTMDELGQHAKWHKRIHIVPLLGYLRYLGNTQSRQIHNVESRLVVAYGLGGENEKWLGTGFLSGVMKIFWNAVCDGCMILYTKN